MLGFRSLPIVMLWVVMITAAALVPVTAAAYGPAGHVIAARAAAAHICPRGQEAIAALGAGESLEDLGLWADRIRGSAEWEHSAPWHYMNIDDGDRLEAYSSPPEGDVLYAIDRFAEALVDDDLEEAQRATALRFLVHFVVDLHQPLHVGRASDRGGNTIDVRYADESTNLHAFWDSDAIALSGLGVSEYAASIGAEVGRALVDDTSQSPLDWAAESLALREAVYDFDAGGVLDETYLDAARQITRERLIMASARLVRVLGSAFCQAPL